MTMTYSPVEEWELVFNSGKKITLTTKEIEDLLDECTDRRIGESKEVVNEQILDIEDKE